MITILLIFILNTKDYEAVINIKDGTVNGNMPRRALSLVFEWLDLHKEELVENWELAHDEKPLNKIEPLK